MVFNPLPPFVQIGISRDESRRSLFSLGNVLYSSKYIKDDVDGIAEDLLEICPNKV